MLSALIFFIICFMVVYYLAPRFIVQIRLSFVSSGGLSRMKQKSFKPKNSKSWPLSFVSKDGLKLQAIFHHTSYSEQKGTIIVLHGIRSTKESFNPAIQFLRRNGYNVVALDLRAHGVSEGKYCTFGYHEKHDVSSLLDTISNVSDINHHFGIWGRSLGAAIALQTLAIDQRLEFGIIESSFSDFRSIVSEYIQQSIHVNYSFLTNFLIRRAEIIANFQADQIHPSEAAKFINQAILISHGAKDKKIKISHSEKIFRNLPTKKKMFLELPEANHNNMWNSPNQKYFLQVLNFIKSQEATNAVQ